MMTKGFDCATPLTAATAVAFAGSGFSFACRYLVPSGRKRLTREEAEAITAAGLQIVSVYETNADRALGGYEAGLKDGATAVMVAKVVGQPVGSCIYFAVDFEATAAQMQTVIDYIRGASEATPDYTTGVYGSFAVVKAVHAVGVCSRYWQTRAWSYGKRFEYANIYQYDCGPEGLGREEHGISVDLNESFGSVGWWNTQPPAEEVEECMLSVEDANKIIAFLAAGYGATPDPEAQAEFHRLANELRKASGQEEE
jgi:hypothetical protein